MHVCAGTLPAFCGFDVAGFVQIVAESLYAGLCDDCGWAALVRDCGDAFVCWGWYGWLIEKVLSFDGVMILFLKWDVLLMRGLLLGDQNLST